MRILLFTLLLCSLLVGRAAAHLSADCDTIKPRTQAKLGAGERLPNGLWLEMYDTNRDGKVDIATMSHMIDGGQHDAHPLFYLVDLNFDGEPDRIYIDKVGEGKCEDVVLYEDLTIPHDMGLNFGHPKSEMGREI